MVCVCIELVEANIETNYLGGELQVNLGFIRQALLQLGPSFPQSAEDQIKKEGEEGRMCVTSQDHTHLSGADAWGGKKALSNAHKHTRAQTGAEQQRPVQTFTDTQEAVNLQS